MLLVMLLVSKVMDAVLGPREVETARVILENEKMLLTDAEVGVK